MTMRRFAVACGTLAVLAAAAVHAGQEVALEVHLRDGQDFSLSPAALIEHGARVFAASWTTKEGGGRPLTKGTGRPLADTSRPLTAVRGFNRVSAPDAGSCAGCHNERFVIIGGGGDLTTSVFVLAQRFDFLTFDRADTLPTRGAVDEAGRAVSLQQSAALRATTGLCGAGYLEMLAREMTQELQAIRDTIQRGETKSLVAKGVRFGVLTMTGAGLWDTSKVEGLPRLSLLGTDSHNPPTLVIRPWHQASHVVSIREFTNTAFNHHHGIQSTERFGLDTDLDGDGVTNELTRADVTAASLLQATMAVPGRVIPRQPAVERAVAVGEGAFERIGGASSTVWRMVRLDRARPRSGPVRRELRS